MSDLSTAQRHAQGERIFQALINTLDSMMDTEEGNLDADMIVSALASALGTYMGNFARVGRFPPKQLEEWSHLVQEKVVNPTAHNALVGKMSHIKLPHRVSISRR